MSIDEATAFLAEPTEYSRLGDKNSVDGHSQFRRGFLGGLFLNRHGLECSPSLLVEMRFDQLQQPLCNELVMLFIPQMTHSAIGISELIEHLLKIAVTGCPRPDPFGSPEVPQAIHRDCSQPTAEGTHARLSLKLWHPANDDRKDILHQIVRIVFGGRISA